MPRFVISAILAVSVVASEAQQTTRQSSAFAPECAVLLNLESDHLDRHGTFEEQACLCKIAA